MALIACAASCSSSSLCLLRPSVYLHVGTTLMPKPLKRRRLPSFATSEDNAPIESTPDSPSPDKEIQAPDKKIQAKEAVQKGQRTAVITGAIAVILGVAYLVLVQLLDSRGVNLVPPPPEAFEM